jgi:hypothetical protein
VNERTNERMDGSRRKRCGGPCLGTAKGTAYPNSPGGGGTMRWYGGGEGERPRGRRRLPACLPACA